MAKIISCQICGDTELVEISPEVLQCRYCKHKVAKPKENADLMERADKLRVETKDFDGAMEYYEEVIRLTPDEAAAYWGVVLCRFGIEYVKDTNGEYLPTCHRTVPQSILDDADFKMAVSKSGGELAQYYREQAGIIDEYQKKIKIISSKEKPYDVFISFKATDERGMATRDSVIAQDIYYYLTKKLGLKVFFSNITLKDKAGQEFEPIIYAALTSSTVMVLVGTSAANINATWVKNEWSRYARMAEEARRVGKSKYLVTAIEGMRPEQLPSTLASYQAVDLSQLGALEKLCANIDGLIGDLRVDAEKVAPTVASSNDILGAEARNICMLGNQALELGQFEEAENYFEEALKKQADTADAHWGKLKCELGAHNDEELASMLIELDGFARYKMAYQYGNDQEKRHYEQVKNQCHRNCDLADARTRHNNEYRTAIEQLKYNYHANYKEKQNNSINEATDKVFATLNAADTVYNDADKKYRDLKAKKSSPVKSFIIAIILGVFILMPGIASKNLTDKLNEIAVPVLGTTIQETDITFDDAYGLMMGNGTAETEKFQSIANRLNDDDTFTELLMMGIPVLIICFAIVMFIAKIFFGWLLAIIGGLIGGGAATAYIVALIMTHALCSKTNYIYLAGVIIVGLVVAFMIYGIVKNIVLKSKISVACKETNKLYDEWRSEFVVLVGRSLADVKATNQDFYNRYGDEIDEYEKDDCIAVDILKPTDTELASVRNG